MSRTGPAGRRRHRGARRASAARRRRRSPPRGDARRPARARPRSGSTAAAAEVARRGGAGARAPDRRRRRRRGRRGGRAGRARARPDRRLGQRRDGHGLRARSPRSSPRSTGARPRSPTSAASTARWRRCGGCVPRDRGAIVQVGSALAYRGIPLQSAYCARQARDRGLQRLAARRADARRQRGAGHAWSTCRR